MSERIPMDTYVEIRYVMNGMPDAKGILASATVRGSQRMVRREMVAVEGCAFAIEW
jgi:hypothetical protein